MLVEKLEVIGVLVAVEIDYLIRHTALYSVDLLIQTFFFEKDIRSKIVYLELVELVKTIEIVRLFLLDLAEIERET